LHNDKENIHLSKSACGKEDIVEPKNNNYFLAQQSVDALLLVFGMK
jgi:hypothetical protein